MTMLINKSDKKLSVSTIVLISFIFVIVLQMLLIVMNFKLLGIDSKMKQLSYKSVLSKANEKSKELENTILNVWSNENYMSNLINVSENFYKDKNADKNFNEKIVDAMIEMISLTQVESSFLIVDNISDDGKKNILELKDYDIKLRLHDDSDISIVTGDSSIVKKSKLSMDSNYKSSYDQNANNIYNKTYTMAQKQISKNPKSKNIGFWHFEKSNTSKNNLDMYYVKPLVTNKSVFYGVLVLKVPSLSIAELLNYQNIPESDNGAYILAKQNSLSNVSTDVFDIINIQGPHIQQTLNTNELSLSKIENKYFDPSSTTKDNNYLYKLSDYVQNPIILIPKDVQLFKNGKQYTNNTLTLFIAVYEKDIDYHFNKLLVSLIEVMMIALVIGIIGTYIISIIVTLPIKKLSNDIKKASLRKGSISHMQSLSILEFDNLIDVIQELSNQLYENSKRFQNIIEQASIPIVAIEKNDDENIINKLGTISSIFEGFFEDENMNEVWSTQKYESFSEKLFKDASLMDSMYDMEKDIQTDVYHKIWNKKDLYFKITTKRIEQGTTDEHIPYIEDDVSIFTTSKTLQVIEDCTKEISEKIKISKERDFDVLTGLLNRLSFKIKVQDFIKYDTSKTRKAAMIMWDLDNLKYVNDTFGHDFGDKYIQKAANIINLINIKNKNSFVARVSGDEFFAFVEYTIDKDEIRSLVEEVRYNLMMTSLEIENHEPLKIRASSGICWYPDDAVEYDDLHKRADFAMYTGKNSNKGNIYEFDKDLYEKDYILFSGKEDLNKLIDERQVKYAFQPIVSATDGSVYAYESLMRVTSESIKNIGEVLRLAKAQSKFTEIEILTFEEVFKLIAFNKDKFEDKKIFINSISSTILPNNIVNTIYNKYSDFLNKIVIELTESEDLDDTRLNKKKKIIEDFECFVAIDDYGSGYATESWLLQVSPDFVKIDMSLIRDIDKDNERKKLVGNIIQYNKDNNIKTIAEGVETYDEMSTLIELGIDYLQGYYLGKPDFDILDISEDKKREIQILYSLNTI